MGTLIRKSCRVWWEGSTATKLMSWWKVQMPTRMEDWIYKSSLT